LYRTVGLGELKAALPGMRIHFIASQPAAELVETNPAIDSVIVAAKSSERRSMPERIALLRSRPLDAVFCYDTGDYWKEQIAVALARIPNCAGYVHKGFAGLATRPLPFTFPMPYSESFRRSIGALAGRSVGADLRPVVHLTAQDENAGALAAERCCGDGAIVAIGITGNQPQGDALKERMLETVAALCRVEKITPVFLGACHDREEIEARMRRWNLRGPVLCGDLSLRDCVAFLRHAAAAFVVDSGLRHMANAAGIPVVYFRNLYTFRGETGNYLPTEHDLAPDVECLSREQLAANPPLFPVDQGVTALRAVLESPGTI
jgi:ADP-heptose:LPS heptosyltransferase